MAYRINQHHRRHRRVFRHTSSDRNHCHPYHCDDRRRYFRQHRPCGAIPYAPHFGDVMDRLFRNGKTMPAAGSGTRARPTGAGHSSGRPPRGALRLAAPAATPHNGGDGLTGMRASAAAVRGTGSGRLLAGCSDATRLWRESRAGRCRARGLEGGAPRRNGLGPEIRTARASRSPAAGVRGSLPPIVAFQ